MKLVRESLNPEYTIKFKTEAQENIVEDLMTSGRTGYPIKLHDIVWLDDLHKEGIVTIKDGIVKLAVNKNQITVFDPNDNVVNYSK